VDFSQIKKNGNSQVGEIPFHSFFFTISHMHSAFAVEYFYKNLFITHRGGDMQNYKRFCGVDFS